MTMVEFANGGLVEPGHGHQVFTTASCSEIPAYTADAIERFHTWLAAHSAENGTFHCPSGDESTGG